MVVGTGSTLNGVNDFSVAGLSGFGLKRNHVRLRQNTPSTDLELLGIKIGMSAPVKPRISSTLLSMAMVIFLLGSQMLRLCCGVEIFRCPVKKELKRQVC